MEKTSPAIFHRSAVGAVEQEHFLIGLWAALPIGVGRGSPLSERSDGSQQATGAMHPQRRLLIFGLDRHAAHLWPGYGLKDRCDVRRIVLLPPHGV